MQEELQNTQTEEVQPPARKRSVWIDKYQIPVYTDLKRADEILYATDTQLLGKSKKNYFAMEDLGAPTEEVVSGELKRRSFNVLTNAVPGTLIPLRPILPEAFMRGMGNAVINTARQAGAFTLKTGLGLMNKMGESAAGGYAGAYVPTEADAKRAQEEYQRSQAWADDFNGKVKTVVNLFTKRAGLDKTEKDGFLYDLGIGAGSVLSSIAALAITRNPAIMSIIFGAAEGQGTYEQAIEAGVEPKKAYKLGLTNAAWISATEYVGDKLFLKLLNVNGVLDKFTVKALKSIKKKPLSVQGGTAAAIGAARGGMIEGVQEATQSVGSNVINDVGGVEDTTWREKAKQALYEGFIAFILGGVPGGAAAGGNFFVYRQNIAQNLMDAGVKEEEAHKVATELANTAISEEFTKEALGSVSGEINSVLTAEDRDAEAFKDTLTEAQQRTVEKNAWDAREQLKKEALAAGMSEEEAEQSAEIAHANQIGFYNLTGIAPEEMRYMKIDVLGPSQTEQSPLVYNQAAAMYRNPAKTLAEFITKVNKEEGQAKDSYFTIFDNSSFRIDLKNTTVKHDKKHPNMVSKRWEDVSNHLDNISDYTFALEKLKQGQIGTILLKIQGTEGKYGVALDVYENGRILLESAFDGSDTTLDQWIEEQRTRNRKKKAAGTPAPHFIGVGQALQRKDVISGQPSTISIAEIVSKIKGTQTFNQGVYTYDPNGKADTNSPEFKAWFGDSKAVDENGQPLVVYHGTNAGFDVFMPSKNGALGQGMYFASNKDYAQGVGKNIMPVYLSIKNPYIADGPITGNAAEFTNKLKQQGYDGVIHPGNGFYVAFSPEQIKSVYNRGTWNAENPNMYYQSAAGESIFQADLDVLQQVQEDIKKYEAGKLAVWKEIDLGATPEVLKIVGIPDYQLKITQRTIKKDVQSKHKVKIETFSNLPNLLADPLLVLKSATQEDSFVVVVKDLDKNGFPVIVAIDPDGSVELNYVDSVYGKEDNNWFKQQIKKGNLLYIDEKEALQESSRLYLRGVPYKACTNSIRTKEEVVKGGHMFYQSAAQDMFAPDEAVARQFKEDVKAVITDKNAPNNTKVDMGIIPPLYEKLGLPRQDLKTNKLALRKALGLLTKAELQAHKDWHNHNVPQDIIDDMPRLLADPVAVFKSNTKKGAFVAVLDADFKGKPIVAAISPASKNSNFTLIPSVYERDNFNKFVEQTQQNSNILYIDEKRTSLPVVLTRATVVGNKAPTNSIRTKEEFVNPSTQTFNQTDTPNKRGSVTIDEDANKAIIRILQKSDASTVVHELAHVHLSMLAKARGVSTDPEFVQLTEDLDAWLGAPEANGQYSTGQQEKFAKGFEGYLAGGKSPNKRLESVFEKFAKWLAEIYKTAKEYLQISPEVRSIFDRLLAPQERIQKSKVGQKLEAAKRLVEEMKKGNGADVEGLSVAEMKDLLKTLSVRKPAEPKNNLLKDLRKHGAEYANAGQIDKEAYKNAKIYDKPGGVDDKPDVWLQKMGYMDFEDSTEETESAAYDLIRRAMEGEKIYRQEDQAVAEARAAFEENLATILQVFPDIKTARETLKNIAQLEAMGYRAVEAKDLELMRRTLVSLETMVGRVEAENTKLSAEAVEKKRQKLAQDGQRIKKRVMEELDKRQIAHKEDMKKLLKSAKTPDELHAALSGVLEQLEAAWSHTAEGQRDLRKVAVPDTNWEKVRIELLKKFNDINAQSGEAVEQARQTLADLPLMGILNEAQAAAKEKAEKVLKESNLEGKYVRAMQSILRDLVHITYTDVAKYSAYLARSNARSRLLTKNKVNEFIDNARKMQERNYKKYMTGKIGGIFSRKVFEKVGSAKRAKYNPEAMDFLQRGAKIWRGMTQEQAEQEYAKRLEALSKAKEEGKPLDMFTVLENMTLEIKSAPDSVPMSAFSNLYETALAAVRGDAFLKKLDAERKVVREKNIRLALGAALENRKLGKAETAYLLHGGTDFQTMVSMLFGSGVYDEYDPSVQIPQGGAKQGKLQNMLPPAAAPVAKIDTKQLGFSGTLKEIKTKLVQWYKENLQGTTAENPELGTVAFTRAGISEVKGKALTEQRAYLVTAAKSVIEKGKVVGEHAEEPNPQGIKKFYFIQGKVELDGFPVVMQVDVAEDGRGNKFYYVSEVNTNSVGEVAHDQNTGFPNADTNSIANKGAEIKGGVPQVGFRTVKFDAVDLLSPEQQQMQAQGFKLAAGKRIVKAGMDAYGFSTEDQVLRKVHELKEVKFTALNYGHVKYDQTGQMTENIFIDGKEYTDNRPVKQQISKEEILTFYLWNKDHEFIDTETGVKDVGLSGRLYRAYGQEQMEAMLGLLSDADKRFADNLQKLVESAYDLENETHRRIYGFSLPKKEFYFPSVTERSEDTIDYTQHIVDNAKAPSFIKKRAQSNMPVQALASPIELTAKHINRAAEFIFEAEKYTELLRIFKNPAMQTRFEEKFSTKDGAKLYRKLLEMVNLQGPGKAQRSEELFKISNKLFNGWVKSALGLKVMTGVKQFASSVSFAENMPAKLWGKYFAEGLKNPRETAEFMLKASPYIQVRYEVGGVNEAVAQAMAANEISPFATRVKTFTNLFLLNTRLGDKASLIYGGYPYIKYLTEVKKLSLSEAARKFELQAVRTMQSNLKANLSVGQANADVFGTRLFLTFKNQQMQYVRRIGATYVKYKNKEASLKQLGKTVLLYAFLNPLIYTALGLGWWAYDDEERNKDILRLLLSPVTQTLDAWPFAGGVAEYILMSTYLWLQDEKLPPVNRVGLPMFEDMWRDMNRAVKTVNEDDVSVAEWAESILEFAKYAGFPLGTVKNTASGVRDVFTGNAARGVMKMLGYSKNRAETVTGTKEKKKRNRRTK